ncbi:hypothetical protein [Adhaeribacter aquaticus]|uniref:hypothetical protein n=1 Tax=Adhaeribacter aquaticus TaxID=299567 RepID=UPI00042407D0|nr:hypothetical protein [Adhaeribacter aquaticus]
MTNPLEEELDIFLENIALTSSMFYQTSTHLNNQKKYLIKNFQGQNPEQMIMGYALNIGDLTGPTDNGYKLIYPTGKYQQIKVKEIEESINLLVKRDGMRCVANCYEVLESFLFDISAIYAFKNPQDFAQVIKKSNFTPDINLNFFKEYLRKNFRGRNNKEILKLIKGLSPSFNASEMPVKHNISEWYQVITQVRHAITHSLFKIDKEKAHFTPHQKEILVLYFSFKEENQYYLLEMTEEEAKKQMQLVAEYGFHIFKCLSMEKSYDWQVLKYMKKD